MTRREAREQAFMLLFEKMFTEDDLDTIIANASVGRNLEIDPFAYDLTCGVIEKQDLLDETISPYLRNWKINRLPKVALSILRLAFYEIAFKNEIPDSVSINEAVELAKKYADDDGPSFINGVLGAYVRQRAQEEA